MAVQQISEKQAAELRTNPGFYLRPDAQKAWERSCAAFGKVPLISLGGALRTYEIQERIFLERYDRGNLAGRRGYTSDVRWWPARGSYYTRKEGTAAAAVPGTSNHGGGVAVDVKTRREAGDPGYDTSVIFAGWEDIDRKRFLRVAAEHGWDDDEGRSVNELWHLTYYPERDQHRGEVVPTPPKKEEDIMDKAQEAKLDSALWNVRQVKKAIDEDSTLWNVRQIRKQVDGLVRTNELQTAAITALAKNAGLDPKAVTAAIEAALKDVTITLTTQEDGQ